MTRFRSSRHSHRAKSRAISWQRYETQRNFIESASVTEPRAPAPSTPCNPFEFDASALEVATSWRFVQRVREDGTAYLVLQYNPPDSGGAYQARPVHVFQMPMDRSAALDE